MNYNMNIKAPKSTTVNSNSQQENINTNTNYVPNVELNLNPNCYDKRFQKFVLELRIVLENIQLANEVIDNADYRVKTLDESVRLVISNLMDLSSNLNM